MFTGIIEQSAPVTSIQDQSGGKRLGIELQDIASEISHGDSIAINGVCLTVADIADATISFDIISETLSKTNLGQLQSGHLVNIERSLKIGDRLDGHFVLGHVDGVAKITEVEKTKNDYILWCKPPADLLPYIIEHGSVALNGVSLTIARTKKDTFAVALIPTTLELTNLDQLEVSSLVNLEADYLAKIATKSNNF